MGRLLGAARALAAVEYLTTIVTRLCLDPLKSARAAREEFVGPWLPEPVVAEDVPWPRTSGLERWRR